MLGRCTFLCDCNILKGPSSTLQLYLPTKRKPICITNYTTYNSCGTPPFMVKRGFSLEMRIPLVICISETIPTTPSSQRQTCGVMIRQTDSSIISSSAIVAASPPEQTPRDDLQFSQADEFSHLYSKHNCLEKATVPQAEEIGRYAAEKKRDI